MGLWGGPAGERTPQAAVPKAWALGDPGQHFCLREWTLAGSAWPRRPGTPSGAACLPRGLVLPQGSLGMPFILPTPCDPRSLPAPATSLQGSFRPTLVWGVPPSLLTLWGGHPSGLWGAQAGVQPHPGLPPGPGDTPAPPRETSGSAYDGSPTPRSGPPRLSRRNVGACHLSLRGQGPSPGDRAAVTALSPHRPLRACTLSSASPDVMHFARLARPEQRLWTKGRSSPSPRSPHVTQVQTQYP